MPIRSSSMGGTPFGISSNRPSSPSVGQTYYNGELGYLEIYTTAGWIPASGANDFNLNISGNVTNITFSQSYASGSYSISSQTGDATLDIYAYSADGSLAGYTNTKSFTATQRFNKMVILGGTVGDVLSFSYKTTYVTANTTSEITSGPFISNITPSFMANANDTITITGGNFATNVSVSFTGNGYTSTPAKSVIRSSSTSLIVTRPDNFPISASPFTVTVSNPSVANQPTGSNIHIASNAVTAGTSPVWNTNSVLPTFTRNSSYSTTLSASDPDSGGSVSYSFVSGSLPSGLSFNTLNATISGTPTSSLNASFTIRATDAGGNYVDRTFSMLNASPTWTTTSPLPTFTKGTIYSATVIATDDSGNAPTYSVVSGSLPTGLSINSATGVISGTPTSSTNASFVLRATDVNGNYTDASFTMPNSAPVWVTTSLPGARNTGEAYSTTLSVNDDGSVTSVVLQSGTLLSGFTYNSSTKTISGSSSTVGSTSVTFRATDDAGNYTDQVFTFSVVAATTVTITSSQSWTAPAGVSSIDLFMVGGGGCAGITAANGYAGGGTGGGGGGGTIYQTNISVVPGNSYNIVVGAGGSKTISNNPNDGPSQASSGSSSTAFGYTAFGGAGGPGAGYGDGSSTSNGPGSGGSSYDNSQVGNKGYGWQSVTQGYVGATSTGPTGGGGGGAGSAGSGANGGNGVTQFGVTLGGGGGAGATSSGGTGGSGGGAAGVTGFYGNAGTNGLGGGSGGIRAGNGTSDPYNETGPGGSGRVMIRYYG